MVRVICYLFYKEKRLAIAISHTYYKESGMVKYMLSQQNRREKLKLILRSLRKCNDINGGKQFLFFQLSLQCGFFPLPALADIQITVKFYMRIFSPPVSYNRNPESVPPEILLCRWRFRLIPL